MKFVIIDTEYDDVLEVLYADSWHQAKTIAHRKYPTHLGLLIREARK